MKALEPQTLEGVSATFAVFSPDGKLLATRTSLGIDLWEVGDKSLKNLVKIPGHCDRFQFTPDGRSLAVMKSGSFALHDLSPILERDDLARWRFMAVGIALFVAVLIDGKPKRMLIAAAACFLGTAASATLWYSAETSSRVPLVIGLGFGTALVVFVLLILARSRAARPGNKWGSPVATGITRLAVLGILVCLFLSAWQFWWLSPVLRTAPDSDLASADIRSASFSADGTQLAALHYNGRLSLFDMATGNETHRWKMQEGVRRPEFASDGRHLLAVADKKAYVLRLKPFDNAAYILTCSEKVLAQNPKSIDALLARGHVRLRKGELNDAVADFTAVITLDDKNAAAYHGRGQARADQGDYSGARADFAAALKIDPKLAVASGRPAP
jgi:hypothetical protein